MFNATTADLCRDALVFRENVTNFVDNTAQYSKAYFANNQGIKDNDALVFDRIHNNDPAFAYDVFPLSLGAPDLIKCMDGLKMHQMINFIHRWQYDPGNTTASPPGSGTAPLFAAVKDPLISIMSCACKSTFLVSHVFLSPFLLTGS